MSSRISQEKQNGIKEINTEKTWKSREAWSELDIRVDNQMVTADNRKLTIRCETNIYTLYRGAAEVEFQVIDNGYWLHGGKVSPTTDQRSGANRGDPDNSALTGAGSVFIIKYFSINNLTVIFWLIYLMKSLLQHL